MEMFTRTEVERKRMMEEEKELDDFERRQEEVRERELLERLEAEKRSVTRKASAPVSQKNSQLKLQSFSLLLPLKDPVSKCL